ncbi:MAG TPA: glycosyltransferase [Patescibacteria group bacterium]
MEKAAKKLVKIAKEGKRVTKKTFFVLKNRGAKSLIRETKDYFVAKIRKSGLVTAKTTKIKDFLFISCHLDMPHKYRCVFQAEQLKKNGLSGDIRFFTDLQEEWLKYYDVFIFYRVPIEDKIKVFIEKAKKLNKMVIYDIDDLVFEEDLVKDKSEVAEMDEAGKKLYFDGIRRHRETMQLCNFGIASTEGIARHMEKYIPTVLVNRNSVPDDLAKRSAQALVDDRTSRSDEIVIGYFSGSKTHDDDFMLIEEALEKILDKHANASLFIVGHLQLSERFKKYENRIRRHGFVKYDDLPKLISMVDINLAPLVVSEFNHGKSEIKFTEAALLKKPTIASATEAFMYAVKEGETGFIAGNEEEWFEKLDRLIADKGLRQKIGKQARQDVLARYGTQTIGKNLLNFIETNRKRKIVYVSPSTQISGGVMVIAQHLKRLQERGYNTSMVTHNGDEELVWMEDFEVPIVPFSMFTGSLIGMLDAAVATMWSTVEVVQSSSARRKFYLVQNKEHLFYAQDDPNFEKAKKTYDADIEYLTVSQWCKQWLKDEFKKDSKYIPNGIDKETFHEVEPLESKKAGKIRILIEGNPDNDYKNVDESFRIIEKLDSEKFETWLISYGGKPKNWYRCDRFFEKVPFADMNKYYSSCDILLKTSKLESFSYPPLEMMACGGVCVVAENGGNAEYIQNGVNALAYALGDVEIAAKQIERLTDDSELKKKLIEGGIQTVAGRSWEKSIDILEEIYG